MVHQKMTIVFRLSSFDKIQTLYLAEEGEVNEGSEETVSHLFDELVVKFVFQDAQIDWIRAKLAAGQSCWSDVHVK